jgi:hypothetical protein
MLGADTTPDSDEISHAFWQACHGGQLRIAQRLLQLGADPSYIPEYAEKSALEISTSTSTRREAVLTWLRTVLPG